MDGLSAPSTTSAPALPRADAPSSPRPASAASGAWPTVSVIIPVRNAQDSIGRCLDAVRRQTYPEHLLEVIVVDGGSQDDSRRIGHRYAREDPRIRLLRNPQGSIPAGLNIGIRAARGEVVARVDARTFIAPDYIQTAVELLATSGAANVGGPVRSVTRTAIGEALALAWSSRLGLGGACARYAESREQWTDTVYLGVFPRRVFETVGLYDEAVPQDEDSELNYRIRAHGGGVLMSPRLCAQYVNTPSLGRIAWKNLQFGDSKAAAWQRHPRILKARHLVPPTFVVAVVAGALLAIHDRLALELWTGLITTYATACLAVSVHSLRRNRRTGALLLPVLLPVIHVMWGLGFLVGVVRRLPAWRRARPPVPTLPPPVGPAGSSNGLVGGTPRP
jgi:succinoglycan biosynthesis protein ExoA